MYCPENRYGIYVTMTSHNEDSGIFIPHILVSPPLSWHVRAYCEKKRNYRGFVFSRFRAINGVKDTNTKLKEQNACRDEQIEMELSLHPSITDYTKKIVEHDFDMQADQHIVSTCLIPNLSGVRLLNIDISKLKSKPKALQIVIDHFDDFNVHAF